MRLIAAPTSANLIKYSKPGKSEVLHSPLNQVKFSRPKGRKYAVETLGETTHPPHSRQISKSIAMSVLPAAKGYRHLGILVASLSSAITNFDQDECRSRLKAPRLYQLSRIQRTPVLPLSNS